MKADHLSYRRATGVALMGLGLQLVLGLALLLYSIVLRDVAAFSGAVFILAGGIVWVTLAVVFDQHRRERIEAMEAESLGHISARESSVFGERPDDLRVAAKRLDWMHKFLVPAISLLFAGVLAGLGLWRFRGTVAAIDSEGFRSIREPGWAIGVSISLAIIGFLFARYVSGMAKERSWANLKAGAAQAAGIALVGLGILVAQLVDHLGTDALARYLIPAVPILMMVIAAETVLNFLLGLYRPRRLGEVPRPAFDSRILGFVAAPDRITESIGGALNYQFGFDVTGSWFYQLLRRSVVALVLVGLLVMWALTGIGVVQPNEQGLRVRLGRQVGAALGPGPYLKLPWPFERLERFDATTVRRVNLGGDTPNVKDRSILWTGDHGVNETYFVVRPVSYQAGPESGTAPAAPSAPPAPGDADAGVAGGMSLIAAEVPLLYEVTDLAKFELLAAPGQREEIIRAVARREVFKHMAEVELDSVLGRGRAGFSAELRRRVAARLDGLDAGIRVLHVGIEGVHPPKDTAEMFESVVQSHQKRSGAVENGRREANATLIKVAGSLETARAIVVAINAVDRARQAGEEPRRITELELVAETLITGARGSAASLLQRAKAQRWESHMRARARAEAYTGQLASYRACPSAYTARLYFDTLRDIMKDARVYIVSDEGDRLWIDTDVKDQGVSGDVFDRLRPTEDQ